MYFPPVRNATINPQAPRACTTCKDLGKQSCNHRKSCPVHDVGWTGDQPCWLCAPDTPDKLIEKVEKKE